MPMAAAQTISLRLLLGVALVLGGGGVRAVLSNTLIELLAVLCLALQLVNGPLVRGEKLANAAMLVGVLALVLPLLQLVPLPPTLWQSLPGRELAAAVFAFVGAGGEWHPMTLDPDATAAAAASVLPALAMLNGVRAADYRERHLLSLMVVIIAGAALVLGALQFGSRGADEFVLNASAHQAAAVGFFVNRNHNADFLLIALALGLALLRWDAFDRLGRWAGPAAIGGFVVVAIGLVLTGSRGGMALLVLSTPALVWMSVRDQRRRLLIVAVITLAVLALGAALFTASPVVRAALSRFAGTASDPRFMFMPDVLVVLRQFQPWGSGFGTFVPVFNTVEQLAIVTPFQVVHAHNDYVEVVLEGGVPGALLIAAGKIVLAWAAVRILLRARGGRPDWLALASLVGAAVIALHSLGDYPLRMLSMMTLFGMLAGLLFRPDEGGSGQPPRRRRSAK